jgi:molybdate transport system substrate-binding protein
VRVGRVVWPRERARDWSGWLAPMVLGLLLCGFGRQSVAADVQVLCPSALREPVLELARSFARSTGHRVEFVFASAGAIHKRVAHGARADVAIGSVEGIDALVKLGPGTPGTQAIIARSALAIAVRSGALTIDASDRDDVERALRAAGSIGLPDARLGVPGAAHVTELLQALQLEAELLPRIRWLSDGRDAGKRLAAGAIELALAPMSDLVGIAGVTVIGPITAAATQATVYAAVVPKTAHQAEAGRDFIAHLRGAEAAKTLRRAGYLPAE